MYTSIEYIDFWFVGSSIKINIPTTRQIVPPHKDLLTTALAALQETGGTFHLSINLDTQVVAVALFTEISSVIWNPILDM